MGEFLTPLIVEKLDRERWRLYRPLIFISNRLGRIEVPVGFETDFASVPRFGWMYAWFGNTAHRAAVIHDYLYRDNPVGNRADSDYVFLEGMIAENSPDTPEARKLMYLAVQSAGEAIWRKYREGDRDNKGTDSNAVLGTS